MHVMFHEYANGGHAAFEVSDDGREHVRELDGTREVDEQVDAWIEAACESNEHGYDRLLEAVDWLTKEIQKRKDAEVRVSA